MAKKKKKKESLARRISGEFSRRTTSEAASQQAFVKSELRTRLESLIPAQFRWLFPFVEDFRPSKEEDDEEATVDTSTDVAPFRRASLGKPLYLDYRCQQGKPVKLYNPPTNRSQKPKREILPGMWVSSPVTRKS
jgi:hypothetical protein